MTTERTMYAVFTEYELDQICETEAQAKKEQRDLRKMGYEVLVRVMTESRAYTVNDIMRNRNVSVLRAIKLADKGEIE